MTNMSSSKFQDDLPDPSLRNLWHGGTHKGYQRMMKKTGDHALGGFLQSLFCAMLFRLYTLTETYQRTPQRKSWRQYCKQVLYFSLSGTKPGFLKFPLLRKIRETASFLIRTLCLVATASFLFARQRIISLINLAMALPLLGSIGSCV